MPTLGDPCLRSCAKPEWWEETRSGLGVSWVLGRGDRKVQMPDVSHLFLLLPLRGVWTLLVLSSLLEVPSDLGLLPLFQGFSASRMAPLPLQALPQTIGNLAFMA